VLDPSTGNATWCNSLEPVDAERIVRLLHETRTPFIATFPGGSTVEIGGITHWNLIRVSALDISEQAAGSLADRFQNDAETQVVKVYLPYNDLWAVDFTRRVVDKAAATIVLANMIGVQLGQMAGA